MIKKLTKTIVVGTLVMSLGIVNVFANSYKVEILPRESHHSGVELAGIPANINPL